MAGRRTRRGHRGRGDGEARTMTTRQKQRERETAVIRAPHDGSEVGVVALAGPEDVRAALDANVAATRACRELPAYERAAALRKIADGLEAAKSELARTLALEAGKPIAQARTELERTIFVFRDAAEEATRIGGAVLPADTVPAGKGRIAITRRFPLAPIAAITPFNFPILLAAHKIAPAMACGATVTLKPPPQDPLTTLRLGDFVRASGYPEGGVNITPCHVEVAQILIEDPRVRLITFTGSAKAGWAIRAKAGSKRVLLELGGNAAVIIEPDADITWAATRCAVGGFTYAGQSCISTQRIYVHERVYQSFLERFVQQVRQLKVGAVNGNDIPGFRVDRLPYGGAKASGLGREGVRYAIEEMTERRVLTLKLD